MPTVWPHSRTDSGKKSAGTTGNNAHAHALGHE